MYRVRWSPYSLRWEVHGWDERFEWWRILSRFDSWQDALDYAVRGADHARRLA